MVNSILVFVASWGLFASIMGVPLGYFNNDYRRDYLHPGFDGVDPYNHEFDYRNFRGYPVHLGNGRFYFLGTFGGRYFTSKIIHCIIYFLQAYYNVLIDEVRFQ